MIRISLIPLAIVLAAGFAPAATIPGSAPTLITDAPIAGTTLGAAAVDTTLLIGPWGSGAIHNGQFQSPTGAAAWNGWTSSDLTDIGGNHWHADTYQAVNGAYSAWCGDISFPSCYPGDMDGGYGNSWDDILYWQEPVANPALPCTVRVQAVLNLDTEDAYDFGYLQAVTAGGTLDLWSESGLSTGLVLDETFVFQPGDYVGPGADAIRVQFRVTSDGGGSAEDCFYAPRFEGALRVDDVAITLSNGAGYSHDFEDGTLGRFVPQPIDAVGDYAKIWTQLGDLDPCYENASPQVAFIDDGVVVPGTGGTLGTEWTYGPNGYVVNATGGLVGDTGRIHNLIVSPPLALPPGSDDLRLDYDVYWHNDFVVFCSNLSCTTNIIGVEEVRSVATGDPADLADAPWVGPIFIRDVAVGTYRLGANLGDRLVPGATHVQVGLGVHDFDSPIWPNNLGENSTPAPYLDNVRLTAFPRSGPKISTRTSRMARDGFPAGGAVNTADLGANSVRFDMIADADDAGEFVAGDSLVIAIYPRDGAAVSGTPRMHYRLIPNPVFDPYRSSGLPNMGAVDCNDEGLAVWSADLPDTGFIFPGDRLHYYFTAEDDLAGDVRMSMVPADTTGFGGTDDNPYGYRGFGYDPSFTMRALPTLMEDVANPGAYVQPPILLWHDSATTDDWDEWILALVQGIGAIEGERYDIFDARSAETNGRALSRAATVDHLAGYTEILYAGGAEATTLWADESLLEAWFQTGNKDAFFTGGQIANFLVGSLAPWTGVSPVVEDDIRPLVGGQLVPRVKAENPGSNPILNTVTSWLAFGECPQMAAASAVTTTGNGVRLAQYTDTEGNLDAYAYAALVLNVDPGTGSRAVTLPWDFSLLHGDPLEGSKASTTMPARTRILKDVLSFFGLAAQGDPADVPIAEVFAASAHPNPFNPETTISYSVARPGDLSLKIFDLRGALVRPLIDGHVEAAGTVTWNGTDAAGARVASGMYFYEARMHGQVQVGKLALVK